MKFISPFQGLALVADNVVCLICVPEPQACGLGFVIMPLQGMHRFGAPSGHSALLGNERVLLRIGIGVARDQAGRVLLEGLSRF